MNERRAEVQRNMARRQMAEVDLLIKNIDSWIKFGRSEFVVLRVPEAVKVKRNLEDLQKRFLAGLAEG